MKTAKLMRSTLDNNEKCYYYVNGKRVSFEDYSIIVNSCDFMDEHENREINNRMHFSCEAYYYE